MSIVRDIGRSLYNLVVAVAVIAFLGGTLAIANYAVTQGTGTNFGSIVVGGTVHYAQQLLCDPTTPSQCTAVSAAGAAKVDGSAVTQPVSGTVTANAGTNLNTSTLATSANQATQATKANQDTNSATTAHTCSTSGTSIIGCLGQVDDDVKGIGQVTIPGALYNTVAASSTAVVLSAVAGGATGTTGDFLSHCVLYPVTTSPGVVTVFDSTSTAANNVIAFAGGATSTSNLTPISVPVQAYSINGAWKVTTGTNVIVTCYGKFH